jgi:rfaE bifunctional protein nucleotidyltransferase chain/domain
MSEDKIKTLPEMRVLAERLRSSGKKLVFTNGCFDLLHLGHVRYLEDARSLGDLLIVGINSDESVKKLKGPGRPLKSQMERAGILAALEAVDYVVVFEEENPIRVISALKPDIHVKGGDYRADAIPEYSCVREYGGEVVIVPFLDGYSTSGFLEIIKRGLCGYPDNGQQPG